MHASHVWFPFQMSLVDATLLESFEERAYAYALLSFAAACYVWQDVWGGQDNPPAKVRGYFYLKLFKLQGVKAFHLKS